MNPGFYGKLPVRGDFLSRRLQTDFLELWDRWLQAGLAATREELGEDWLNCYLGSPVWRFALAHGVCGPDLIAGVLIPSVDRVGRYFPLTLAAVLTERTIQPGGLLRSAEKWYDAAEEVLLSALDPELDLEAFDRRVEDLDVPSAGNTAMTGLETGSETHQWWVPITGSESVAAGLTAWHRSLLGEQLRDASLWWTSGSARIQPCLLVCRGLPEATAFPAMLAGDWSERNWRVSLATEADPEASTDEEKPNS